MGTISVLICVSICAHLCEIGEAGSQGFHRKITEHFIILYQDKYIDVEEVYKALSRELNLEFPSRIPQRTIIIQEARPPFKLNKRNLIVWTEPQLRHELTKLLFYPLQKNAPLVFEEGIATYKEENKFTPQEISLKDIMQLEGAKLARDLREGPLYRQPRFYEMSAAWVGSHVEKYGIEKFKEFYVACKNMKLFERAYKQIYVMGDSIPANDQ